MKTNKTVQDNAACYRDGRIVPGSYLVMRLDGSGFSKFTQSRFKKPFDVAFWELMNFSASSLMRALEARFVFFGSDEISIIFERTCDLYGRRVEKLLSEPAGMVSGIFSCAAQVPVHFDNKLFPFDTTDEVVAYFNSRRESIRKNAVNDVLYWYYRQELHYSAGRIQKMIDRVTTTEKEADLREKGLFDSIPDWALEGSLVHRFCYEKDGFNPLTQQTVTATRWGVKTVTAQQDLLISLVEEIEHGKETEN